MDGREDQRDSSSASGSSSEFPPRTLGWVRTRLDASMQRARATLEQRAAAFLLGDERLLAAAPAHLGGHSWSFAPFTRMHVVLLTDRRVLLVTSSRGRAASGVAYRRRPDAPAVGRAHPAIQSRVMPELDELLDRLEELLAQAEQLDEDTRALVFEILDGVDALHRTAVARLATALGPADRDRYAEREPWIRWLFDAYAGGGVGEAVAALAEIAPYIASHGGEVEVLEVTGGVVRVRMAGACSGCTASAVTLREGVERALREALPWFAGIDVEEDDAPAHPPPGPTLLQIQARPATP